EPARVRIEPPAGDSMASACGSAARRRDHQDGGHRPGSSRAACGEKARGEEQGARLMFPAVFQLLHNAPAVAAIVGDRIGAHGEVPQDASRPYITYSGVDQPYDQLDGPPSADFAPTDINCWHQTDEGIRALAKAVRDALDAALI